MGTWLPNVGCCESQYFSYKHKAERDYAASQAHKFCGYIKHSIGQYGEGHRITYWLNIYFKYEEK